MRCNICEFRCDIPENGTGKCRMYINKNDVIEEIYPDSYLVSVPAPIEAMPMTHLHPNSKFMQVCTIGCNFKCSGCVSWIMTENTESIDGALERIEAENLVQRALNEDCKGIMFCFNEPAVSFHTFKRLAKMARGNGLLVGCATNGYFTAEAFQDLLRHIDFINIGLKGHSDDVYKKHGAGRFAPTYRNLELAFKSGIHTEVAAVFIKGMEDEMIKTGMHVASLSREIPFQVMRFVSLRDSSYSEEPSIRESEKICEKLKKVLDYVYLFNSPGTEYLNTYCPGCGSTVIKRGFNGPMCSNVTQYSTDGICECGENVYIRGSICQDSDLEALGYFGGYKNILFLENIRTILAFLGESDTKVVSNVIHRILKDDFIKSLYLRFKQIPSYLDTVDYYASLAGRQKEAKELRHIIETMVSEVLVTVKDAEKPRVYFALGHPLIAVFGDKFECNLVEIAGGYNVNRDIQREEIPGNTIPIELLNRLDPEIILIQESNGYPAADFYDFCIENGIKTSAVENKRIFNINPFRSAGSPDWVLGLLYIAKIIHPELFDYDVKKIADDFYNKLFGTDYDVLNHNRTFDVLLSEQLRQRGSISTLPSS